ncbi:MAG: hypothetical protein GY874_07455 [Desulfobacteraceae bacterium]|nr:hypothetical protein [Desulfobacteraceae bacterium]
MDDFVAQHPKLASLLPNAGTAAVVAMLLKDPRVKGGVAAGAVVVSSYLIANYGYDKLMQLAEGSLEQQKENLATFFVNHDKDITQEQADYLANFTINLLTDVGGRMIFHQVAAQGFNKVRKAGKVAKGAVKGSGKQKGVAQKASTFLKFRSNEAGIHFSEHGNSVMVALGKKSYSLVNYLDDANHVIRHGTFVPELNGYVKLIGGQGSAKFGFVGLNRATRHITTFHIKTAKELAKKAPSLEISL